jgi:hypothetical protein
VSNSTVRTIVLDAAGNEFLQWPIAEPADILDYLIDATLAVGNDYIASASVSVTPSGTGEMSPVSVVVTGAIISVKLSGGVAGRTYLVRIDASTQLLREYSWVVTLPVSAEFASYPLPIAPVAGFGSAVAWFYSGPYRPITPVVPSIPTSTEVTSLARTIAIPKTGNIFLQWPVAEAQEDLDYYLDAAAPISQYADSIYSLSVSIAPSGAGELQTTYLNLSGSYDVEVWLSGGVAGRVYTVRVDVATDAGRTFSWPVTLPIDMDYSIPPFSLPPDPGFGPPFVWVNNGIALESGLGLWGLESGNGAWFWG